jgi:hypothetical protein
MIRRKTDKNEATYSFKEKPKNLTTLIEKLKRLNGKLVKKCD